MTRHDLAETLKDAARGTSGTLRHGWVRAGLVVAEVALALMLLIGAGLLLLSFGHLLRVSPGFNPQGVVVVNLAVPPVRYEEPLQRTQFFDRVQEGLRALPGVSAASASSSAPFGDGYSRSPVAREGAATIDLNDRPLVFRSSVLPGLFSTLGIPLRRGRDFDAHDDSEHPKVVIINETLARKLFGAQDPLGHRLLTGIMSVPREIIGVVGDTRSESLTEPQSGEMYYPNAQLNEAFLSFLVRTEGEPAALRAPIQQVVRAVDAGIPVPELQTVAGLMTQTYADRRLTLWLVGGFAGVALAMAVFGIYSVMAYSVAQRTGEIGIRLALGAQPRDVRALVIRQGMTLAGTGLALGIAAALSLTHAMAALLFGVGPRDPWAFAAVTLLLAGVSLLACWWPALRAARVDPMIALRAE
ncbi:MAG TPA: hypothetical protein DCE44_19025 [Verrucomicrobiales bacterium]|nr:hypothetical protein [Verrucomicrobiales bacterium]